MCMCALGGASYCCPKSLAVLERGHFASSLKKKSCIFQPKKMAPTASASASHIADEIHGNGETNAQKNESLVSQWSVKVCHDYFEKRPWPWVMEFYSLVVAGHLSFYDLRFRERSSEGYTPTRGESTPSMPNNHESVARICSEKGRGGKWERRTFRALLSYCGASFFGWQRQPGLLTVQGVLEKALGRFVDGKRARALSEEGKDPEANISVAGRTDKGVHAVGQVCSFYTWMRDIQPWEIEVAINAIEPHKLRALHVEEVCRTFHPNFSAKWRRYVYLLPLSDDEAEDYITGDDGVLAEEKKINVERANRMLCKLEGHNLSYAVFARDTQSSRSRGTATMCTIFHARANVAELPLLKQNRTKRAHVVCVEIVADRFLRKMVRVLVATAIREAAAGAADTALIMMTQSTCRRDSAPPAPALGLCLAEVGYEDMKEAQFLIH